MTDWVYRDSKGNPTGELRTVLAPGQGAYYLLRNKVGTLMGSVSKGFDIPLYCPLKQEDARTRVVYSHYQCEDFIEYMTSFLLEDSTNEVPEAPVEVEEQPTSQMRAQAVHQDIGYYDHPLPGPQDRPLYLAMVGQRCVDLCLSREKAALVVDCVHDSGLGVSRFTNGHVIVIPPNEDPSSALQDAMPGAYVCWW